MYDTLEEFLVSGHSYFPVSELSQRLKQKSMKVDGNKNEYQLEFEVRPFCAFQIETLRIEDTLSEN